MSPNRRILLNIIATYGRSLYGMVVGLFCGRWKLMALGEIDYGLLSVVGGLTAFISFLNMIFASATSRFFAFAIGQAQVTKDYREGLEECRRWFSLALSIHLLIPTVLMVLGYPAGLWAIRHYLTIPPERIEACIWVFRFVCVSCFLGMASVPFNAMYIAKQYIAELTLYSFATVTLNVVFLYYAVTHPGQWMTGMALWSCLLAVVPQLLIALRAILVFPECKFSCRYCFDRSRFRKMAAFAGWSSFGSLGMICRNQGIAIVVNRSFGPSVNAAMGIANSVNAHAQSLASAMQGAFIPVITTSIGAGDIETAKKLVYRFCKFGTALALLFMIPVALELPTIITIWLKTPPKYTVGLCWIMLAMSFIDKTTFGFGVAVRATGNIKWYQIVLGTCNLLAIPIACLLVSLGGNVFSVGCGMFLSWAALVYGRLYFSNRQIGTSTLRWLMDVMGPIGSALAVSIAVGLLPRVWLESSLLRIAVSALSSELIFIPALWFFVLDADEKHFIVTKLRQRFSHG